MFCPDGYVTLYDCQAVIRSIARKRWEKERPAFYKRLGKKRHEFQEERDAYSDGDICDSVEPWDKPEISPADWEISSYFPAFRRWATALFVTQHCGKLKACSPSGKLMRLSQLFCHTQGDFRFTFSLDSKGFAELEATQARLTFIEEAYFTIKSVESLPLYVPENVRRLIQPFVGWSVCWEEAAFKNLKDELERLIAPRGKEQAPDPAAKQKPPTVADEGRVTQQIIDMFDKDNQVTKGDCSAAANPQLGTKAFERAWRAAREKRPDLGKSGRPRKTTTPAKPPPRTK